MRSAGVLRGRALVHVQCPECARCGGSVWRAGRVLLRGLWLHVMGRGSDSDGPQRHRPAQWHRNRRGVRHSAGGGTGTG